MWDKRVHRGNTYSMYTQAAIKEALEEAASKGEKKTFPKRKPKEASPFDMPLPEMDRIAIDLSGHLTAPEEHFEVETVDAQTDEWLFDPPEEPYQPQKTGVDVHTQVEDGELFDFDQEVEPILDVLVMKTIEQALMEVEEEHEMRSMKKFQSDWHKQQEERKKDWQAQVDEEVRRWEAKEVIVQRRKEEKRREAQVLLKLQAISSSRQYLSQLVPNAVADLEDIAFPDKRAVTIDRLFLPQLLEAVQKEVQQAQAVRQQIDGLVASSVQTRLAALAKTRADRERAKELVRQAELDKKAAEEDAARKAAIEAAELEAAQLEAAQREAEESADKDGEGENQDNDGMAAP